MEIFILKDILVIIGISAFVLLICHRFRIPVVVGFLLTGLIVGPHGLRLVGDINIVKILAEIGVVLLLFTIGLEFSFRHLFRIKRPVILGGSLQVSLTLAATFLIARYYGQSIGGAVFISFLVSLSSTAIVMKLLHDRAEMDTPHGNTAVGILIFQDIMVVPMMLCLPLLAGDSGGELSLMSFLGQVAGIGIFVLICTKWLVPWLFDKVARTLSRELFLLSVIAVCLAVAWLTHQIGLSLALGAFLAGLIISESEYSRQALGNILPFRDVFTSFFFVSIGMLLDIRFVLDQPVMIGIIALGVLMLKSSIAILSAAFVGLPIRSAVLAGIALCQIGEFSFILSASGMHYGLITAHSYQMFLAVSVLTMMTSPFAMAVASPVAEKAAKLPLPRRISKGNYPDRQAVRAQQQDHLVIIGFGLNGRNLARAAAAGGIPYIIIEMNPAVVKEERAKGEPIYFGDATQEVILRHADIHQARSVAILINDPAATRKITELTRRLNPGAYIIVRTRFVSEIDTLSMLGADEVIPEEFETSVEIFSRVMGKYFVPKSEIEKLITEVRSDGYEMFRSLSREAASCSDIRLCLPDIEMTSFRLAQDSPMAGKTLLQTEMRKKFGVTLLAINRNNQIITNPGIDVVFQEGDILFVVGQQEQIAQVERRLVE